MPLTVENLEKLNAWREKMSRTSCHECKMGETLADSFSYPVVSRGNGRVMFVGPSVMPDEHKSSEPFTSAGGSQADNLIQQELQISTKNDCYLTNVTKCRGNLEARISSKDKRACGMHLMKEIALVDPVIIVFLGTDSAKVMLGKEAPKVGTLTECMVGGRKRNVFVMNNITTLLKSVSLRAEVIRQFAKLKFWLSENTDLYEDREDVAIGGNDKNWRKYTLVDTTDKLVAMYEDLKGASLLGIDTETNDLRVWHSEFRAVGFSIAKNRNEGYYIPVGHLKDPRDFLSPEPVNLDIDVVERLFYKLHEHKPQVVYFNVGFDYGVFKCIGWDTDKLFYCNDQGVPMWHDTSVLWYFIDENISDRDAAGGHQYQRKLKNGAKTFLNIERLTYDEVVEGAVTFEFVSPEEATPYAAADAVDTWALMEYFYPKVRYESRKYTGDKLLNEIYPDEMKAALVAADLNIRGMGFDQRYRDKLRQALREDALELSRKLTYLGAPVPEISRDGEIKKLIHTIVDSDEFWVEFEAEYGKKFDKTARSNMLRFYRQKYEGSEAFPGRFTPDQFEEWMNVLNTAKKIDKILSTYVQSDKVERFVETKEYDVEVGIDPEDGKVKEVYTPGWRVAWGEILPSFDTPADEPTEGYIREPRKAYQDVIHGSVRPNGAGSGRTSSHDPNLQNLTADVPERPEKCAHCGAIFDEDNSTGDVTLSRWTCKECGEVTKIYVYDVRRMYTPHAGYYFAKADWDAQEVSLMAAASGCPVLTRLVSIRDDETRIVSTCHAADPKGPVKKGRGICSECGKEARFEKDPEGDLHTVTAAKINGITPQQLFIDMMGSDPIKKAKAKKMRKAAKPVNFGIMYGIAAPGLQADFKNQGITVSEEEAQEYIDMWYELFYGVKNHVDRMKLELKTNRRLVNMYGRVRHTPYQDDTLSALNFLIQGAGANIAKRVLGQLSDAFKGKPVHIINLIHDEVILEYKLEYERELAQAMFDFMNVIAPGKELVPLTAEPELRVKSLSKGEKSYVIRLTKSNDKKAA
jgi:uracil-DNA glycosylase family 4